MQSKVLSVLAKELNENLFVEEIVYHKENAYVFQGDLIEQSSISYPVQIKIQNNSGLKIGFIIIQSEQEEDACKQNPDNFDWVPIENGWFADNKNCQRVRKILLRRLEPIQAMSVVTISCLGFTRK